MTRTMATSPEEGVSDGESSHDGPAVGRHHSRGGPGRCVCPREREPVLSACHRSATLCFDACLTPKNTDVLGTSSWHLI